MKCQLVIARYNENIEWTNTLTYLDVCIYNKGEPLPGVQQVFLKNVGREGHTYYHHICSHYDELADYTYFVQGNPFDHSPNILQQLQKEPKFDFEFLSERLISCNLTGCIHHEGLPLRDVYEKLFQERKEDMKFIFGAGAQFIVSRNAILKRPKSFYEKIVSMLENHVNPIEGFVIERFHKLILGSDHSNPSLEKNIFILWLQGWENAKWLNQKVAESWRINNPDWTVHLIDLNNLKNYVSDIDYIYDPRKKITPQAKSDIIRLSLLKNHGGVWADATMLCMQPLDHWINDAIEHSGLWMYHGHGGGMVKEVGPASWFIVSKKGSYMIRRWKEICDHYWKSLDYTNNYFWMDSLFRYLFEHDTLFKELWLNVPYLYCELDGQSHTLAHHGIEHHTPHIQHLFETKPPYALKLWKTWNDLFPDITTEQCKKSNGYCAIQLSTRQFRFKHPMS